MKNYNLIGIVLSLVLSIAIMVLTILFVLRYNFLLFYVALAINLIAVIIIGICLVKQIMVDKEQYNRD